MQPEQRLTTELIDQTSFFLEASKVFDSLLKKNKKMIRDLVFESLTGINLKLPVAKEACLNALLDYVTKPFETELVVVLVRMGEYINILKWDLKQSQVTNNCINDPELILVFAQLMTGCGRDDANELSWKLVSAALDEIEIEINSSRMKAYPVARILGLAQECSTEVIGIFCCREPISGGKLSLWNLSAY
jgi:hypothetical protein